MSRHPSKSRVGALIALLILIATLGLWGATGAHTGWSQTQIPVEHTDEITGLTYTEYGEGFVAGVDVLGAGISLSALVLLVSFFLNRKPNRTEPTSP